MATTSKRIIHPAFTLVELLVVLVIIALLLSITLVVTSKAMRAGEITAAKYLMQSISEGIEQFHNDFGYYPPLLVDDGQINDPERPLIEAQTNSNELFGSYRYFSVTTLPVYLIGVGRLEASNTGTQLNPDRHDGHAGPGFRDPGPDRSWGGAIDRDNHRPSQVGRVYGPYVDIGDGDSIRELRFSDFASADDDPEKNPRYITTASDESRPDKAIFVLQDPWGTPIRYYQPQWRRRDESSGKLTLDFIPAELLNTESILGDFMPEHDREILAANYVLLSAGPDRDFSGDNPTIGINVDPSIMPMTDRINTDYYEALNDNPVARRKAAELIRGIKDNIRIIR